MIKSVKCPTCNKKVKLSSESSFRPFCSERCRLIDLGEWAAEKNAIPAEPIPSTEEFPYPIDDGTDKY